MAKLVWGIVGERYFETGVDRGVLYVGDVGVPWNGLTAVNEAPTGGDAKPYYLDGIKYANLAAAEEFAASIEAYSSPQEFAVCDGTLSVNNGLFVTQQPRKPFGFSYRTRIGNDLKGTDYAYKIHLVYNALAAPASPNHGTLSDSQSINALSWGISTTPPRALGFRPTAHFVIDSRFTPAPLLSSVEDILYGSDAGQPRLPTQGELLDLFNGGVLILRNRVYNPKQAPTGGTAEWGGRYSWTRTLVTYENRFASRLTVGSGSLGPDRGFDWYSNADVTPPSSGNGLLSPVTAGERLAISFDTRASIAGTKQKLRFRIHNGAGAWVSSIYLIDPGWTTSTDWQRLTADFIVPNTGYLSVRNAVDTDSRWTATDWLEQSNLYIGSPNPYFDGDAPMADNINYSWEGAPDNSPSIGRSWTYTPPSFVPAFSANEQVEIITQEDTGGITARDYLYYAGDTPPSVGTGQEVLWLDTSTTPNTLNYIIGD